MDRRQRRVFPEAFKREAVDRVASSGLSAGAVAQELGLHETVLRRWMVTFGTQATGAARRPNTQAPPPSPSDLAAENARLRRENDRLRMERDILKKPRSSSVRPPVKVRVRR
jgi:transposase